MTIKARCHVASPDKPVPRSPLEDTEASSQARLLKALADPTRLRLVHLFLRDTGIIDGSELAAQFRLERPTMSYHLRILRDAGVVECQKQGAGSCYSVRREALARAQAIISQLQPTAHA